MSSTTPATTSRSTARSSNDFHTARSQTSQQPTNAPQSAYTYPPEVSISLIAPYNERFKPHNHKKHRNFEPQINQFDVVNLQSDRDPDAVM